MPLQFRSSEEYQIAQILVQLGRETLFLFHVFVFLGCAQILLKVGLVEELVWAQFSVRAVLIRDILQI